MATIKQATGNTVITEPSYESIMGSKVASKAWRALILASRLNYIYPKDTASNIQTLVGMTNVPGLGRLFEIKNVHWARRGSRSINENKDFEGEATLRRNKLDGNSAHNPLTVDDSHRTALKQIRNRNVPLDISRKEDDLIQDKTLAPDEETNRISINIDRDTQLESNMDMASMNSLYRHPNIPRNEVVIFNLHTNPYVSLYIQNRPTEVNVNPGATWVSIKSMGRNNPFYMYTGGEDTISFEISWFNNSGRVDEVLAKCRLLESWTRANGYLNAPPTLKILWGNSNIFGNYDFILESCPYRLTNFQNASRDPANPITPGLPPTVIDKGLYPACATQTLTFKKVISSNTLHSDILDLDIAGVSGINLTSL